MVFPKKFVVQLRCLSAVVWLTWVCTAPAWSQDGAPESESTHEHDPGGHPEHEHSVYEVTVQGERDHFSDTHAHVSLDDAALEQGRGQGLAEAISVVPGVSMGRGSSDQVKPIIRGQVERRLLTLYDGVRHESQKWGVDHATEIDSFSAGQISVIKGSAGVRYGPDAIGGVILVEPPPMRAEVGVGGRLETVGVSNGGRASGAGRLDYVPASIDGLSLRAEASGSKGADLVTPDYVLGNTASALWTAGVSGRFQRGSVTVSAGFNHYDLAAGICFCTAPQNVTEFEDQLDRTTPLGAETWTSDYQIERPYQRVRHDRVLARVEVITGAGVLTSTTSIQRNHRQEFESARASIEGPQYDFLLRTTQQELAFEHGAASVGRNAKMVGTLGAVGSFQDNIYSGLPLIPNHRALTAGVYGIERLRVGEVELEAGARYDRQGRTSYLTEQAWLRQRARGSLGEEDCTLASSVAACALNFDAATATGGMLWHAVDGRLDLKMDVSSASRFPNGDELYFNGSAPTSPVFALGDPSLGVETSWSASPTVGLRLPWIEAEGSAYLTRVDDYIQLAPELDEAGDPQWDVTIRGAFPRFSYSALDARFMGMDGGAVLGHEAPVGVRIQGALVRGVNRDSGDALLYLPGDTSTLGMLGALPDAGGWSETRMELSTTWVARQRPEPPNDLAPPPPGYSLLSASVRSQLALRKGRVLSVSLFGGNLMNVRYRDATSLLRYTADEVGREVRLRFSIDL